MNLFLCIFKSASRALKEFRGISLSNARRALQPHFTRFAFDLNKTLNQPFPSIFVGHDEQHEIQRQNRITEQILTNFFERKFFPNRKPKPAPTIDEILPPESRANPSIRDKHSAHKDDDDETDNLQSVESEQIDSFYRDYSEGRWKFANFLGGRWLCPCFMCFFIFADGNRHAKTALHSKHSSANHCTMFYYILQVKTGAVATFCRLRKHLQRESRSAAEFHQSQNANQINVEIDGSRFC